MRGLMFTSFIDWVSQTRGPLVADQVISSVQETLTSQGAYTAVGDYPSQELTSLATALANAEGTSTDLVMRQFGRDAFDVLNGMNPAALADSRDLFDLLSRIEGIIHVQVRKLYPTAKPPLIEVSRIDEARFGVTYRSHRDMVDLCQGLIEGAARHFPVTTHVSLEHVTHDQSGHTIAQFLVEQANGDEGGHRD